MPVNVGARMRSFIHSLSQQYSKWFERVSSVVELLLCTRNIAASSALWLLDISCIGKARRIK